MTNGCFPNRCPVHRPHRTQPFFPLGYRFAPPTPTGFTIPPSASRGDGASNPLPGTPEDDLVYARDEGPLVTIAPTGAGKGRSVIIPTFLSYRGPVIVIDPKGEAAAVTARWRRQLGPVAVIAPFEVVTDGPESLNPIDALQIGPERSGSISDQALALTEQLKGETPQTLPDPYWDNRGTVPSSAASSLTS